MTFTYSLATGVLAWVIFVVAVAQMLVLLEWSGRLYDGARRTVKAVIVGAAGVVLLFALILAAVHGIATVIGGGWAVQPEPDDRSRLSSMTAATSSTVIAS